MRYEYRMTVQDFADLIVNTVYECGYFQKGELRHPEDIQAAFISTATAVAKGATFMIRKNNSIIEKIDYAKENNTSIDSAGNAYLFNKY